LTQIAVSNAGVEFGATRIFQGITFTVGEGERWAILGRNGSGKTTLFRLITGSQQPTEGAITRQPGLRLALLEQHRDFGGAETVWQAGAGEFADLLALASYKTYGQEVIVTRCSNNYGPFQFPEKLIPLMIIKALRDEPLPVYGDGMNVRDWIHVKDHCAAIVAALFEGKPGSLYNFGGDGEMVNVDVVKLILKKLGKPESLISFVVDRLGHDRRYAIDSSFAQRELTWKPRCDFKEGLDDTIQWYIDNQAWWQPLLERAGRY
jgi:energy-coupling factor transporter ATP-binding protein EcfA2